MQHFDRMAGIAAAALCAASLSGCAARNSAPFQRAAANAVAPVGPPAKRAEIPPPAPSADSLWRFGHWSWVGEKFVWTQGGYIQRPAPTANWVPGYWEEQSGGWVWNEGHWET